MKWPNNFVEKAKSVYPDWTHLHTLLDKGSLSVYTLLKDAKPDLSIPYEAVLAANNLDELKKRAQQIQDRHQLYMECCSIVNDCI